MKNFLRSGRGLPFGQGYVCLIKENKGRLLHFVRNDEMWRSDVVFMIFCVLFSGFLVSPAFGQDAEGLNRIVSLKVGDVVPDDFWTQEHLLYTNGDTVRTTLERYRGKLMVLDFWMVGCSKCFFHQSEINYFKSRYKDELAVVMVNGMRTKNDYKGIHKFLNGDWVTGLGLTSVSSIIESEYLDSLFNPSAYPAYYWINRMGILQTVTFRNLLDRDYSAPFLDN